MEMNTIIGIVIAVVIMLIGLVIILKKQKPIDTDLDETEAYVDADSQQPVLPRHERQQLLDDALAQTKRVEPSLKAEPIQANTTHLAPVAANDELKSKPVVESELSTKSDAASEPQIAETSQQTELDFTEEHSTPAETKIESELSLNPNIETVEIAEFEGESIILDVHLHEQQRYDDESALATAEQIIALNVYANPRHALLGEKALKVLLKYGLRFGEMSCFHRYENTEDPSALMFSVLRITDNGPAGFDLESLATEQVQGLAFFLALPNSKAVTGYDMMTSIAGLIAREIEGKVYDENNLEFTPQLKEHWRHHVIDYRPNQSAV